MVDQKEKKNYIAKTIRIHKKPFRVNGIEFVYLYLLGIGFSMVGWIIENCFRFLTQRIIDCRFHLLPFISPYALIPIAFQLLLKDPDQAVVFGRPIFKKKNNVNKFLSNLFSFALITSIVFFGELTVGNLWECLFGVQLWNYSFLKYHLTRYAALFPALVHGTGTYLFFKFLFHPILNFMRRKVPFSMAKKICSTLGVLIVCDTCLMMLHVAIFKRLPMYWSVKFR